MELICNIHTSSAISYCLGSNSFKDQRKRVVVNNFETFPWRCFSSFLTLSSLNIVHAKQHDLSDVHVVVGVDRFYIALFSALSSRLTALACDSTRVTSILLRVFWISNEVVYLQRWHGWCHGKLLPSQRKFCVHRTTMHHVTSWKATSLRTF